MSDQQWNRRQRFHSDVECVLWCSLLWVSLEYNEVADGYEECMIIAKRSNSPHCERYTNAYQGILIK
jgi:hypothetical protein